MAKLFLDATDTSYKVSNGNTEVFGANGDQAITIDGNLTGVVLDANVERVAFTGVTTDYTYKQVGTDLEVYNSTGALVTKVGLQDDTTGTQLTFANGTVDAKFAPSATGLGLTVGGQTVSATAPAAVTIPAANIDVTTYPITSPTFSVASVAATATEGSNAVFTVTLANPATTATTVQYALSNVDTTTSADYGTATATGTNVTDASGVLTFAAGATTATVTLPVSLDSLTETTEGVSLTLSNPTGGAIVNDAGKVATVSFVDAPATTFTLTSNGSSSEIQEGQSITFTVTPNAPVNAATTLVLNVQGKALGAVTSVTSAADFESTPSITFAQGETAAKTITLKVATDSVVEGREAYAVDVIDTTSYSARGNQVTGVITDKLPILSLSQNVATVAEGATVTYTVTSDENAPTGGITIPFTVTGTATSGTDYTALTASSITIAAGTKTGSVTLTTTADTFTDGADETVIVTLGTAANATVDSTKNTVTTTITDSSKALGTAEMTLTGATSVDEGSTVTYTVTLGAAATTALSVPYTLSGTATSGTDYTASPAGTITIAAGSKTGTLTLTTTADSATEGAETAIVTLGTVTGFTAVSGQNAVTTTINDTSVAVAGQSFSLTTAIDNITGTAGDDTIQALEASLGSLDVVNGGAGVDNFVLASTSAAVTLSASQLSNIETLTFLPASNAATITLAGVTGVTTVANNGGSVGLTVGVGANSLGVVGAVNVTNTAQATTVVYKETAVTGTSDAVALTLSGATGTVNLDTETANTVGLETVNITSTGVTNNITLATNDTAGLATVNVAGSTAVTVTMGTNVTTTAKTINASTSTGGVTIKSLGAAVHTITGGSGNDTFEFGANYVGAENATATNRDSVDGRAGRDTLSMTIARANAAAAATQTNATNFEILTISDAWTNGLHFDATKFTGVDTVNLAAGTAGTSTLTVNSGTTVVLAGDSTANSTTTFAIGGVGASDSLTLNMAGFDFAGSGTETFTGIEILNINTGTAVTDAATFADVTTMTASAGGSTKVVATGVNALTFTGVVTAAEIDASALTGVLTVTATPANAIKITGGTKADVITGSASADLLTGGLGADLITGNAGDDSIVLTETTSSADRVIFSASGSNGSDTITGFVTGTDKLDFNAPITGANGTITQTTAASAAVSTTSRVDFVDIITTAGTAGSVTTSGSLTLATADLTAATLTNVAAFLAEHWTGNSSATGADTGVFVINSTITGATSGNAYIYQWDNDTTANVIQAGELALIGTIVGGTVASGDIIALA